MSNITSEMMIQIHENKCMKSGIDTAINRLDRVYRTIGLHIEKEKANPAGLEDWLPELQEQIEDVERFLEHIKS